MIKGSKKELTKPKFNIYKASPRWGNAPQHWLSCVHVKDFFESANTYTNNYILEKGESWVFKRDSQEITLPEIEKLYRDYNNFSSHNKKRYVSDEHIKTFGIGRNIKRRPASEDEYI